LPPLSPSLPASPFADTSVVYVKTGLPSH